MSQVVTFCAVQMTSSKTLDENLQDVEQQLRQQDLSGVHFVVLPEMFAVFGVRDQTELAQQEREFRGPVGRAVRQWAQEFQVWIVAGTVPVMVGDEALPRARCHLIDHHGELAAHYDKIHLFDAVVGDRQGTYRESDTYLPGNDVVTVSTPWGCLGLAVCYDLRFPELFRALNDQGAEFVILPSAFTALTGEAHWDVLCRARAIENAYVLFAVNQCGQHDAKRATWGHSMLVDSWGRTESMGGEKGCGIFSTDLSDVAVTRQLIPVNENRRMG